MQNAKVIFIEGFLNFNAKGNHTAWIYNHRHQLINILLGEKRALWRISAFPDFILDVPFRFSIIDNLKGTSRHSKKY